MDVADFVVRTLWIYNSTPESRKKYRCAWEERNPTSISAVADNVRVVQAPVHYHHSGEPSVEYSRKRKPKNRLLRLKIAQQSIFDSDVGRFKRLRSFGL